MLDQILANIPNKVDRAYDMRHALLYMAFPDIYEPCISTQDKQRIVEYYKDRLGESLPKDTDQALLAIRKSLLSEHDDPGQPIDFYQAPYAEWRTKPAGSELVGPMVKVTQKGEIKDAGPSVEYKTVQETDSDLDAALMALAHTRNVILHGPPGTGKTFIARQAAEAIVRPQTEIALAAPARAQQLIEGLTFYDVLALSMYLSGPRRGLHSSRIG